MELLRVFNNNVVLARDEAGREVVLTGRGVGFQMRPGDRVDPTRVVRTFVPDPGRDPDNFAMLLTAIPPEHLQLTIEAVEQLALAEPLPSSTIVALADHISFAVKRARAGVEIDYPLRAEVAHLYPDEVALAERLVSLLDQRLEAPLDPQEALPIALHLVNAGFRSGDLANTYQMTGLISQIFDVIEGAVGHPISRHSANAARFIAHLRYFFVRAHAENQLEDDLGLLADSLTTACPEAALTAARVADVISLRLGSTIAPSERTYLAMHIARLTSAERLADPSTPQEN